MIEEQEADERTGNLSDTHLSLKPDSSKGISSKVNEKKIILYWKEIQITRSAAL